jgi:hypothetical protein
MLRLPRKNGQCNNAVAEGTPQHTPMPRITISYRRDDSGVITGRIFDRLVAHYGRDSIFRDIDNIPLGVDFRGHIERVFDASDIVLAIVGPRWIGPRGGQSRISNEADPVRVEIEAALRKNVPLIPVLVFGATMPRAAQLPDSIKDFAYRNGIQVDAGQDFDLHIGRLIRALDTIVQGATGGRAAQRGSESGRDSSNLADGLKPPHRQAHSAKPAEAAGMPAGVQRSTTTGRSSALGWVAAVVVGLAIAGAVLLLLPGKDRSEVERQKTAEVERQKAAEVERQKQADAKRQALAETERQKQIQVERQRAETAESEQRAYNAAKGNPAALRLYTGMCRVCAFATEARSEIDRLDAAGREEQAYAAAKGHLDALAEYVNNCKVCEFESRARSEITRLRAAAEEEQTYGVCPRQSLRSALLSKHVQRVRL